MSPAEFLVGITPAVLVFMTLAQDELWGKNSQLSSVMVGKMHFFHWLGLNRSRHKCESHRKVRMGINQSEW